MFTISSVTVAVILACTQHASVFAVRCMFEFQGRLTCSGAVSVCRLGVAYQQLASLLDACASAPPFFFGKCCFSRLARGRPVPPTPLHQEQQADGREAGAHQDCGHTPQCSQIVLLVISGELVAI